VAANDYVTVGEIKAALPDENWGNTYDTAMGRLVTAASRAIDRFTKREPGFWYVSADTTRYFDGSRCRELWIGYLAAAPTSLSVAESGDVDSSAGTGGTYTAWSASDYLLWPYNAIAEGRPYQRLDIDQLSGSKSAWYGFRKGVKIVGKFGWSTAVPSEIGQVALIQAMRWFKRGQQSFQDTGAIVELGQLTYAQQLDPDIAMMLDCPPFREVTI
jgi:hypothetical protein